MKIANYLRIIAAAIIVTWLVAHRGVLYPLTLASDALVVALAVGGFAIAAGFRSVKNWGIWAAVAVAAVLSLKPVLALGLVLVVLAVGKRPVSTLICTALALAFFVWAVPVGLAVAVWGSCLLFSLPWLFVFEEEGAELNGFDRAYFSAKGILDGRARA